MTEQTFFTQTHTKFEDVKPTPGMCSYACARFFKKSSFGFDNPAEAVKNLDKRNLLISESQVKNINVSSFIMIYCYFGVSETGHSVIYNTASKLVHSPEGNNWVLYTFDEFKKRCGTNKNFKKPYYFSYFCGNNKILSLRG